MRIFHLGYYSLFVLLRKTNTPHKFIHIHQFIRFYTEQKIEKFLLPINLRLRLLRTGLSPTNFSFCANSCLPPPTTRYVKKGNSAEKKSIMKLKFYIIYDTFISNINFSCQICIIWKRGQLGLITIFFRLNQNGIIRNACKIKKHMMWTNKS